MTTATSDSDGRLSSMADLLARTDDAIQRGVRPGAAVVPSGFSVLDRALDGGFRSGELVLLALQLVLALVLVVGIGPARLAVGLDLAPDLLELGLHHPRGHLEVVILRQFIKELALQAGTGGSSIFALELLAHALAQRLQAVET